MTNQFLPLFSCFLFFTTASAQGCREEEKKERDRPDLAWEQDFRRTRDPALGYVPQEGLRLANKQTRALIQQQSAYKTSGAIPDITWVERGPDNVAGRTRALMFDPNDGTNKKVWAGGVSGGLWYNTDITNANSSWVKVDDFWSNITVTCIAADPNNPQIFYVGTGESRAQSGRGEGIWKTTDGGTTWNQLSSTTDFYFVNDIVVRNESGTSVLYAAIAVSYYENKYHGNSEGLQRSTNGGMSFTQVMPDIPSTSDAFRPIDIEVGADNRLYVGTANRLLSDGFTIDGGGYILYSGNGTSWTIVSAYASISDVGRVELACAPSDANIVYGIIEANSACERIIKSADKGVSWTDVNEPVDNDSGIPATDFTRGQAWYDLSLAVDPNNSSRLVIGGIDLFITSNSGSTWDQIGQWYNMGEAYSEVHADQHAAVFAPGSSNTIVFGNDGGVFYTSSLGSANTSKVIVPRNKGYNVTQFYSCAIHPAAGSDYFLAGAQDNGTQVFSTTGMNSTTEVWGGDGAYCFIDEDEPDYQVVSYIYNSYYLYNAGSGSFLNLSADQSTGDFINAAAYDSRENILYSAYDNSSIQLITDVTTVPGTPTPVNVGLNDMATAFKVSPYSLPGSSTVFIGTASGGLYKVTNAQSGSPTVTSISGGLPFGSISCIDVGASDNNLLVTFFNYGINSVWQSSNGGNTWTNKDGNLPDMPVRACLYNPSNRAQVLLGAETGVWSTDNVNAATPDWVPTNNGLANVRVDMLRYRPSDKLVAAATYGRGLFTTTGLLDVISPAASSFSPADNSTNVPGNSDLVITFSEAVQKGTGNIVVKEGGVTRQTIDVASSAVSINSNVVTINPSDFTLGAAVNIEIAAAAFKDMSNNNYAGITAAAIWNFTVSSGEFVPPTIVAVEPADNTGSVSRSASLSIVFSENVQKGAGNILIKESGITTQTINVTSTAVSLSGSAVTIDPSDFTLGALVNVEIAGTAFQDLSGNAHAGIADATTWNFTVASTADITAPTVLSFNPPDNSTNVQNSANLTITFSENIYSGTGKMFIKESGIITQTISAGSAQVSISGATVIINPSDLSNYIPVNIEIQNIAFRDAAGNYYTGVSDAIAWNFTTNPSSVNTISPLQRSVKIYPNPGTDELNIGFYAGRQTAFTVRILTINGQVIYTESTPEFRGEYRRKIDVAEKSRGIYFLQITTDQENINKKIILR